MRWVWPLVIACLMAASVVRPARADRRDSHTAELDAAPTAPFVIARRQPSQLPELRLAPYVVARAHDVPAFAMVTFGDASLPPLSTSACAIDVTRARGPPLD